MLNKLFFNNGDKSQFIRILDILFIGPFMIYMSYIGNEHIYLRIILAILGILTILYNFNNYIITKQVI